MEMDQILKNDIENFYQFIAQKDIEWVNTFQEIILTCLSLLLNENFHKSISILRIKHKVPNKWFTTGKLDNLYNDELVELLENSPDTTLNEYSNEFSEICVKCGVTPKKYNYFVYGYFYLADVKIDVEALDFPIISDDYKYKCGIEVVSGDKLSFTDKPALKDTSPKAYIRFYKDTTINQLIEFIKSNKDLIRFIQKRLAGGPQTYPHTKSYGRFKRDLQVYLLHLLGNKAPIIAEQIVKENIPEGENIDIKELEKIYSLENDAIRQIIKDIKTRVHNATLGPFKV